MLLMIDILCLSVLHADCIRNPVEWINNNIDFASACSMRIALAKMHE